MSKTKISTALVASLLALGSLAVGAAPEMSLSPIQKACRAHARLKSAVIEIRADLPEGWQEETTVAYQLPGQMHVTRTMKNPGSEPSTMHYVVANGQLTVCSLQPNTDKSTRSAYYQRPAPKSILGLGQEKVQLGLTQFLLNLATCEPSILAGEGKIIGNGTNGFAILQGEKRDELTFDDKTGLLVLVEGKISGQSMAKATVSFRSTNQPIDKQLLEYQIPTGARQMPAPKNEGS